MPYQANIFFQSIVTLLNATVILLSAHARLTWNEKGNQPTKSHLQVTVPREKKNSVSRITPDRSASSKAAWQV